MQKKQRPDRAKSKSGAAKKKGARSEYPDLGAFLAILALSLLLFLPLFLHPYVNGDDTAQHYWWTKEFVNELSRGNLYPRWLSGAYDGRGSPVLFYYPPVPFYAASFFYLFIREPLLSLYWGCWSGLAISGVTMYFFARTILSRGDSFLVAAFYMAMHYHLFDFYQRMAQHEFWAFAWGPLILYGINRINQEKNSSAIPFVALGYALLLMTHLPTALIFTVLIPVYALILTRDLRQLARIAFGLVLGAGMAAIFVGTYLYERGYLKPLVSKSAIQEFDAAFVLEHLKEAFGQIPFPANGNINLFILAGDWIAAGFFILVIASTVFLWKSDFRQNNAVRGLWVMTVFGLLMSTRISTPIWLAVKEFQYMQFPIRWYAIVSLGAAFLAAVAISQLIRHSDTPYFQVAALAVVILLNLMISWLVISRAPYQQEALRKRLSVYTDVREYHPRWWDEQRHTELDAAPAVVVKGNATITPANAAGTEQSYTIQAAEDSVIKFRTLYFPGWEGQLDGQLLTISPNAEGHIQAEIPQGNHKLTLNLKDTPMRMRGKLLSGFSLLVFFATVFITRRRRSHPEKPEVTEKQVATQVSSSSRRKQRQT